MSQQKNIGNICPPHVFVVLQDGFEGEIVGIYSTLKKAKRAKKMFCAETIQEYTMDYFHGVPDGMWPFSVIMDKSGTLKETFSYTSPRTVSGWNPYHKNAVIFHVCAKNKKQAMTIANQQRIELIQTKQWTTSWNQWRKQNNHVLP